MRSSTGTGGPGYKLLNVWRSANFRNSVWNIAEVLLTPAVFFVSIPLFLHLLGAEGYGEWMFFNTLIVVLQLFDFGLSISTYKHIAQNIATNRTKASAVLLHTNILLSLFICLGIVLLFLLLYSLRGYLPQGLARLVISADGLICTLISCGILFTRLAEKILYSAFRAYEQFKTVTILSIFSKLIVVPATALMAYLYQSVTGILFTVLVFQFLGLVLLRLRLRPYLEVDFFSFRFRLTSLRLQLGYSVYAWLQSIAVVVAYQMDRLFVSLAFGMATLSYYSIAAALFSYIHMALMALTPWLFPKVARMAAKPEKVQYLYFYARNITAVISIPLLTLFGVMYPYVIPWWLGAGRFEEVDGFLKWFTVFELFFIFTINQYTYLNAAGQARLALLITLMFTGLNILGLALGYWWVGTPESLPAGLALSSVPAMYCLHYIMGRYLKQSNSALHSLLLIIPSLCASGIVLFSTVYVQICLVLPLVLSLYFIFLKPVLQTKRLSS
jgi:O-antigen/teichoic acid export membrane protein